MKINPEEKNAASIYFDIGWLKTSQINFGGNIMVSPTSTLKDAIHAIMKEACDIFGGNLTAEDFEVYSGVTQYSLSIIPHDYPSRDEITGLDGNPIKTPEYLKLNPAELNKTIAFFIENQNCSEFTLWKK